MWWVVVPWLLFVACLVATLLACRASFRRQHHRHIPAADEIRRP